MLTVGMPSWTLRVRISCRKTTQSVGHGIPTRGVGTSDDTE